MKKVFIAGLMMCSALSTPLSSVAETANSDVMTLLRELQETVKNQQQEITELRQQLETENTSDLSAIDQAMRQHMDAAIEQAVDERIEAESLSQLKAAQGLELSKHVEGLKLKADLRLRYERRERDDADPGDDDDTRDRFRQRFRLGLVWNSAEEDTEFGVGLATGGIDGTSTNDTFSEVSPFETGDIRLDYAYAKHKFESGTLILGQQKNPFKTSAMFWDGDVRPAGVTYMVNSDGLFATAGVYDVMHVGNDEADALLWASQFGLKFEGEESTGLLAAAYYHFNNPSSTGLGGASNYDYQIVDVYGELKMDMGEVAVTLFGNYAKNFGADGADNTGQLPGTVAEPISPDGNDTAYLLGVGAKTGPWKFSYQYVEIEADSLFAPTKDSDFGGGSGLASTDVEGHVFKTAYKIGNHLTVGGTIMLPERISVSTDKDKGKLYQVDLAYKF